MWDGGGVEGTHSGVGAAVFRAVPHTNTRTHARTHARTHTHTQGQPQWGGCGCTPNHGHMHGHPHQTPTPTLATTATRPSTTTHNQPHTASQAHTPAAAHARSPARALAAQDQRQTSSAAWGARGMRAAARPCWGQSAASTGARTHAAHACRQPTAGSSCSGWCVESAHARHAALAQAVTWSRAGCRRAAHHQSAAHGCGCGCGLGWGCGCGSGACCGFECGCCQDMTTQGSTRAQRHTRASCQHAGGVCIEANRHTGSLPHTRVADVPHLRRLLRLLLLSRLPRLSLQQPWSGGVAGATQLH
jgi:hypothetical protein